ncbi:hypothetical protein [Saccharothrix sp. 6-C]|uniref:hypothetical protein n=1 Tax=Saccharothrix sp. 6-C TaxID=2781735 RepID=UPI001F3FA531|nr:hypothetical protein [Saccharothrix sp. 6-C]
MELARLARDPGFRAGVRRLAEHHVLVRDGLRPDPAAVVRDATAPAVAAGVEPTSARARRVVAEVLARVPHVPVERLAALLEAANDPRRERCPRLSAVVNGWPPPESATPAFGWFLRALGRGPVDAGLCGSVPLG